MRTPKLKITICSYDGKNYFGGPYEWLKRLGPALQSAGIEVSFLFFSDHQASDAATYNALKAKGFNCRLLHIHSFTQYNDHTEGRIKWLLKEVQKNPPDVLIANGVIYGLYATPWLKKAGIHVVGVLHSDDAAHEYIYQEFIRGSDDFRLSAVVGVSDLLSRKAMDNNSHGMLVSTISCGTPIPLKNAGYRKSPFKIIYAGKLTEVQKRITETTYALCEVVKRIPGTQVEIYGSGSEQHRVVEIIKQEASGYDIQFKGLISSDHIQDVFSEAQAFVLLSDYEGLPVALMESMAVGLVPICTAIESGIPELIEHNVSGLLVNNRKEDFYEAVNRLVEDADLWNRLSENAIRKVKETHTMPVIVSKWIQLFDRLLTKSEPRMKITIPHTIHLPPVNPLLKGIDQRKDTLIRYIGKQVLRANQLIIRKVKNAF